MVPLTATSKRGVSFLCFSGHGQVWFFDAGSFSSLGSCGRFLVGKPQWSPTEAGGVARPGHRGIRIFRGVSRCPTLLLSVFFSIARAQHLDKADRGVVDNPVARVLTARPKALPVSARFYFICFPQGAVLWDLPRTETPMSSVTSP